MASASYFVTLPLAFKYPSAVTTVGSRGLTTSEPVQRGHLRQLCDEHQWHQWLGLPHKGGAGPFQGQQVSIDS